MRINPPHTIGNHFHPPNIQEDKGKKVPTRPPTTSVDADQVALSPDSRNLGRLTALAASEHIENVGIDAQRLALVKQRIASGFYDRPEIMREIEDRITNFLLR